MSYKILKHKLLNKKRKKSENSKYHDYQIMPTSCPPKSFYQRDVLLLQSKYMALDFHEERKFKKNLAVIMTQSCIESLKTKKVNKRINNLAKDCYIIYLNMNGNNNITGFSCERKNINNKLNEYTKLTYVPEYFKKQFKKWKIFINEYKPKLNKYVSEINISKIGETFLKLISFIENVIKIQEESFKKIPDKFNNNLLEGNNEPKLSDFALEFEKYFQLTEKNNHIYSAVAENSNIDYNKIVDKINQFFKDVKQSVDELEEKLEEKYLIHSNNGNLNKNENKFKFINHYNNKTKKEIEDEFYNNLNNKKIFFDNSINENLENIIYQFKDKYKTDKCVKLNDYNVEKLLKTEIDTNSIDYNFENVFHKIFKPINFYDDFSHVIKFFDKDFNQKNINNNNNINNNQIANLNMINNNNSYLNHINNNNNLNKKKKEISIIDKTTILQKMVVLWAISQYGINHFIINEILNMFSFTKTCDLDNEEISILIERVLKENNVDSFQCNFSTLKPNYYKNFSAYIDAPIQISNIVNFNYSEKLKKFINGEINSMNDEINFVENEIYFMNELNNNIYSRKLNFINNNPLFMNDSYRLEFFEKIKEFLINYSKKVIDIKNNNFSIYDYYSMEKIDYEKAKIRKFKIDDVSCYSNIKNNKKEKKINKQKLLEMFNKNNINDFSNRDFLKEKIEKTTTHPNNDNKSNNMMVILSFNSPPMIQKEWETMRTPWYQNNYMLNPKFKKGGRNEGFHQNTNINNQINPNYQQIQNNNNPNNNSMPLRNIQNNKMFN